MGAVTVIRVLLSVLHVSIVRECEGDGNSGVGAGRGVFAVSAGCEYMGGTPVLGIVSSVDDVIDMSVASGVRSVGGGGVEMCVGLARGGVGG